MSLYFVNSLKEMTQSEIENSRNIRSNKTNLFEGFFRVVDIQKKKIIIILIYPLSFTQ